MTTRPIALAAALAAAIPAAPALAEQHVAEVGYADLDLTAAQGQARLHQRIEAAARKVCRDDTIGRLASPADVAECLRKARQSAALQVAQIESADRRGG